MNRFWILILLTLVLHPALAGQECLKPKTNYERKCGEVSNLHNLPVLAEVNDCAEIRVKAHSHWNASGLRLQKGHEYRLEVARDGKWCDANVVTDGNGWQIRVGAKRPGSGQCPVGGECGKCRPKRAVSGPEVDLGGFYNGFVNSTKWLARKRDQRLFTLIGVVEAELAADEFVIGNGTTYTPKHDAEFCAYANDLSFMYWNNSGELQLTITRVK